MILCKTLVATRSYAKLEDYKHKLAHRSNLTFQSLQIMSKLSKVKRKYLKLVLIVALKLQQVN